MGADIEQAEAEDEQLLGAACRSEPAPRRPSAAQTLGHLCLGQVLALLVCCTGIFSKRLAEAGVVAPTAQSFTNYLLLAIVWRAVVAVQPAQSSPQAAPSADAPRRWRLRTALVVLADVEANYIVVKAYSLTSFTSVQLLDCASLPLAMLLSMRVLGRRYSVAHGVAVAACIGGLALLVVSDAAGAEGVPDAAPSPLLGDLLCLASGALYAASNVGQEAILRSGVSSREWLARLGCWGALLSALQIALLERSELARLWGSIEQGTLEMGAGWVAAQAAGFGMALFLFYSLAPRLLADRGAVFFNLSLLTADFWAVAIGAPHCPPPTPSPAAASTPLIGCAGSVAFGESDTTVGRGRYLAGFGVMVASLVMFNLTPERDSEQAAQGKQGQTS